LWLWAFQLYLAPIFLAVAVTKFSNFDDMVAWFGNADSGLGLPMPV
jgi:putative oxidoreductase|tara:strand:+ start:195 stop:332 length:138 start_codon:yes stop_codon:yes gene_type:complete